jgi:hypothetical protein
MLISSAYGKSPSFRGKGGVNVKRIKREIALRKYRKFVYDGKPRLIK